MPWSKLTASLSRQSDWATFGSNNGPLKMPSQLTMLTDGSRTLRFQWIAHAEPSPSLLVDSQHSFLDDPERATATWPRVGARTRGAL